MFATFDIVEVAERGRASTWSRWPPSTSGSASASQLHWLRDRIVALPRDDRWRALARAALRDDLYGLHRALTAEVLAASGTDGPAEAGGRLGRAPTAPPSAASRRSPRSASGKVFDTTTLPVAVREVRNLLQAG